MTAIISKSRNTSHKEIIDVEDQHRLSDSSSFFWSWQVLGIYIVLVLWTPMFPVRPLPPIRLDDYWLLFILAVQFIKLKRFCVNCHRVPSILLLLLAVLSGLSTTIDTVFNNAPFYICYYYDSAIYIRMFLILILVTNVKWQKDDLKKIFTLSTITISCQLIVAVIQYVGIEPLNKWSVIFATTSRDQLSKYYVNLVTVRAPVHLRPIGTIGNPNFLSFFLAVNISMATCLFMTVKRPFSSKRSIFYLLTILFSSMMVFFCTTSRSGLLIIYITVFFLWLSSTILFNKIDFRILLVLALTIFPVIVSSFSNEIKPPKRIKMISSFDITKLAETEGFTSERIILWSKFTNSLRNDMFQLWIGNGSGYLDDKITDNGFLRIICQQGLVGGLSYSFLLIWAILRGMHFSAKRDFHKSVRIYSMCLVSCIVIAVFADLVADAFVHERFGVFTALIIGLIQREPLS